MIRRRVVAAVSLVGENARDGVAGQRLHVQDHAGQRVTVIGIAGLRLHMGDELAALGVVDRGGNGDFDAERVRPMIDVKQRGLQIVPKIAVGDDALGFWKALDELFPGIWHQRRWVHKTVNVLDTAAERWHREISYRLLTEQNRRLRLRG